MNLCSDGHDEVCYEGRHCPACTLKDERDDYASQVAKLEKRVEDLDTQLGDVLVLKYDDYSDGSMDALKTAARMLKGKEAV